MRTSPQAEQFKKCLPEELQEVSDVSFSYQTAWHIVTNHLKTLYGKYADPQYCLDTYYASNEYKQNCQMVRRCPDIPLINKGDIQRMLREEDEYSRTVNDLLAIQNRDESTETITQLASLLGVLPEDNPKALYRYLVARHQISDDAQKKILETIRTNSNLLMIITKILTRNFLPGYLLEFPATGSVMTQPRGRYYYRGENAYFRSSKASAYRSVDTTKPTFIQTFIDRLRLYQCWETLDQFDAVRHWGLCEVNYMALAQHYGFRTQMLDITSDLKTALFFACCKYEPDRKWHPLTNKDFAHRNSRTNISTKCGGDSRYGILYRSPSEITDLIWCTEPKDAATEIIIPVGFQPLMRCSQQHGYMLLTKTNYDLFRDERFDKFKFRLTEEICNWIFEEMDQGTKVYPNNDIPDISLEIEKINKQMTFSRDVFNNAANGFRLHGEERDNVLTILKQYDFDIVGTVSVIMPEKLAEINKTYSAENAMQKPGIVPQLSPILLIPGSTLVDDNGQLCL